MIYRRRERTSPYIRRAGEFLSLTPPCNEKEKTERETEDDEPVAVNMEREGDEDAQPPNAKRTGSGGQQNKKRFPKSGKK
jgi:hypothetical protein